MLRNIWKFDNLENIYENIYEWKNFEKCPISR